MSLDTRAMVDSPYVSELKIRHLSDFHICSMCKLHRLPESSISCQQLWVRYNFVVAVLRILYQRHAT